MTAPSSSVRSSTGRRCWIGRAAGSRRRSRTTGPTTPFTGVRPRLGLGTAEHTVRLLYARLAPTNFSREVLATRPANLAVLPVAGLAWSDWGQPDRVLAPLARMDIRPSWAESLVGVPT